VGEQETEE